MRWMDKKKRLYQSESIMREKKGEIIKEKIVYREYKWNCNKLKVWNRGG